MEKTLKNIPFIFKIGYGTGNLGSGLIFQSMNTYLVFYATAVLNLPGVLVGIAVSLSIIIDGISDPVMGYISDRTYMKTLGRRHLYLLIGTFFTALINYFLWIIDPALPLAVKFIWLFIAVILVKLLLTVFSTPYVALGAELSSDYNERTSIQAVRTVFFILGVLFASGLSLYLFFNPTAEYPLGQLNPAAYRNLGLASSTLMLVFGLTCFFATFKFIPQLYKIEQKNSISSQANIVHRTSRIIKDFSTAIENYDYRCLVLGYLFTNLTVALFTAIGLHVFTYTFNMNNNEIAIIIGLQFLFSIFSQPVWVEISRKIDKRPSVILGIALSILSGLYFLLAVFYRDYIVQHYLLLLPYSLLAGFGTGGLFSLPGSMVADIIDVEELKTGLRLEGIYYGCFTFAYKTSQSVAILLLGLLLDIISFDATSEVQPEAIRFILGFTLALGGIFFMLLAWYFYRHYRLDSQVINKIQAKIRQDKDL